MIRPGTVKDAAAIAPLFQGVQALHAAHIPAVFKPPGENQDAVAWLKGVLAGPNVYPLVAEIDGNVVGYLMAQDVRRDQSMFRPAHRYFMLEHITVAPAFQDRGIGTDLMHTLFAEAIARQIARVELEVWNFNEKAQRFFARHGFHNLSQRMEAVLHAV